MAAGVILMAILGCGDAGNACEAVSVAPARYESVSACVAAQEDVLARTDIMYPVVVAECRPAGSVKPAAYEPKAPKPANPKPMLKQAALRT